MNSASLLRLAPRRIGAVCSSMRHTSGMPLTMLSEDELMMKATVDKYANEVVRPHVREMDKTSQMRHDVIHGLFQNGVSLAPAL